jgi:flagella basal body P-ring formation protein FlgA
MSRRAAATLAVLLVAIPATAVARVAPAPLVTTQVVSGARLAAVADPIARRDAASPDRTIAPAATIRDQIVPAGSLTLRAGRPLVNSAYVTVPVAIVVDGNVARTVYAGFTITSYVKSAVAAHDLVADTVLGADDIAMARVPYTGRPPVTPDQLIGRRIRTAQAAGTRLGPELTAINQLVRAGTPTVLLVHDGPVVVAADVVARTSGGLGQNVSVFNPQTQRSFSGVVTGPNTVELTLPGSN